MYDMKRCLWLWLSALLLWPGVVRGQVEPVWIERVTGGGFGFVRAGDWGLVRAKVVNAGAEPVEVTLEVHDPRSSGMQFARRVWLPGESARLVDVPVRVAQGPKKGLGVELQATLEAGESGRRVGRVQTGAVLFRQRDDATTVLLTDDAAGEGGVWGEGGAVGDARSAVSAVRDAAGLGPTVNQMRTRDLPTEDAAWGGVDALVLATREPLPVEAVPALRRWLAGGGRLWVMLDRVDADAAGRLVGSAWDVGVVGEVELPGAVRLTDERASPAGMDRFELPPREGRRMLRVLAPDMEPVLSAGGWPAALEARVGRGRVLVTTLDHASWVELAKVEDAANEVVASRPVVSFVRPGSQMPDLTDGRVDAAVASYLERQIGYEVLGRWPVALTFAVLLAWLLGAGVWAWRRGRGEWAAASGVAGALAAAVVLVVLGRAQRGQTPTTLAELRLTRALHDTPHASTRAAGAVFLADADAGRPPRVRGGGVLPELTQPRPGELQRVMFDGAGGWELATLDLPPGGVVAFDAAGVTDLSRRPAAVVRVTEVGLMGELDAQAWPGLEDARIVGGGGRVTVTVTDDGGLVAANPRMQAGPWLEQMAVTPEAVARRGGAERADGRDRALGRRARDGGGGVDAGGRPDGWHDGGRGRGAVGVGGGGDPAAGPAAATGGAGEGARCAAGGGGGAGAGG